MLGFKKHTKVRLGTYGPLVLSTGLSLSQQELASHIHCIGLTKQGKSKLLASICAQLFQQGISFALVDPHTDLAADVLQILLDTNYFSDPRAYERLWYVDFARRDRYVPFNVLHTPYPDHDVARHLVEVCKRAWSALGDGAAPLFEQVMLNSGLVLVQNRLQLTALPRLITDRRYREALLENVTDPMVVSFWHDQFDQWGRDTAQMVGSTLRRVSLLTFAPTLRYSLGQTSNILRFRELMDRRVSVIFNLGGLDEDTQRFLGSLITVGYEVAALSRADMPEVERNQYHLVLDEFSMFSAQSEEALARVLSLTRKYGLYLVMAHQTWSQVSQRLQGALQNCLEIAFKLGRADAERTAPLFGRVDPLAIKHEVPDPWQADRTHPVFYSLPEQWESWVQAIQDLKPRECFVRVGDRTAKIRTVTVATKASREELRAVQERYAQRLLTPHEEVASQVDGPRPAGTSRAVSCLVSEEE